MTEYSIPSETLAELIGKPYKYTVRGWLKIFGKGNADRYKKTTQVMIDRDYIWRAYNASRADNAVSPELGQILMYAYCYWVKYRAGAMEGMLAEAVHDEVIMLMAGFHRVEMKTDSPFNSMLNLFTRIRKQTAYKFFGDVSGTKNAYHQRRFAFSTHGQSVSYEAMTDNTVLDIDPCFDPLALGWDYGSNQWVEYDH